MMADALPSATSYDGIELSKSTMAKRQKRGETYIPRAPNCFILFRTEMLKRHSPLLKTHGMDKEQMGQSITFIWRSLPKETMQEWKDKAERVKVEHAEHFPDYRYKPDHSKARMKKLGTNPSPEAVPLYSTEQEINFRVDVPQGMNPTLRLRRPMAPEYPMQFEQRVESLSGYGSIQQRVEVVSKPPPPLSIKIEDDLDLIPMPGYSSGYSTPPPSDTASSDSSHFPPPILLNTLHHSTPASASGTMHLLPTPLVQRCILTGANEPFGILPPPGDTLLPDSQRFRLVKETQH